MFMATTPADTMAMVEALQSRVTKLEDERAILDTLYRYARAADDGDYAVYAEVFTEDGIFQCIDRAGAEVFRVQGREALAKYISGFRANETKMSKHHVVGPIITIDGETAAVECYGFRVSEGSDPCDPPSLIVMGRYHDDLVKDGEGRWQFRQRVFVTESPRDVSLVARSGRLASRDASTIVKQPG
jgi:SnoaL-like domain